MTNYVHVIKFKAVLFTVIFFASNIPIGESQLQTDFGKQLIQQKAEPSNTIEPELLIDYQFSNVFNDHIEFGLSIDPNTSSLAGREDPQLSGLINRAGVNLQGTLPLGDRFGVKLQYTPQFENYIGENGQLNEFDAMTDIIVTEVSFQATPDLPALLLSHQLQRLNREDDAYDSIQRQIGLRFGKVLEYNLRLNRFDDEETRREDFLLVGSTSHQGGARLQLGLLKRLLGKLEYSIERESYKDNLNILVLGVAGIKPGESRLDMRQFGSAKLIQIASDRVVLQEEFSIFMNSSNVDFYDFLSAEVAFSAFYKIDQESWARLRLSRLGVGFDERRVRNEEGIILENAAQRRDTQLGLNFQLNWKLHERVTLLADYQLIKNDTNEEAVFLDFLNYTNNIASITIQASH
ncbi:MAG: hypothetical protein OXN17_15915 [Candidatus Poribacteria bacterium]|nr:hypothetical protein [Candidatus Poribacteria bacterium]MDE0506621.1 hypothetical protein [Candidatus Poribacteria bacterium]